jgi:hypothetical protein
VSGPQGSRVISSEPLRSPFRSVKAWRADRAYVCTFCGRPLSATVGCPDDGAPVVWQVGICNNCLVDCVMRRFSEVKHQRISQLAEDMRNAANAIAEARKRASWESNERNVRREEPDPEVEAAAAQELAAEEERIAREHDMCPGWSYDEFERDYHQAWRERRRR